MDKVRVVVTGLGAVTPLGNTVADTWQAMLAGRSGAAPITAFDAVTFKTQFAAEVKHFDCSHVVDRKEARKMDRYSQFSVVVANEALKDSGLDLEKEDKERIGVVWGSGMGGLLTLEQEVSAFGESDGVPRFNPFMIPKTIPSMGAGQISILLGLKGLSYTVSTACSSSSHAITCALDNLRTGRADVIFTGGAEAVVSTTGVGGFNALHALSTRNDSPATASRPFSASRDGFVLGEGAGCLVLETLEHAQARGAHIYAELCGGAFTSDAYHMTAPDPEGKGARRVMELALRDASMKPEDIDYVNTHGTSTPLGDVAELQAIKDVFGEHAFALSISSTKSMTGHLIGATGVVESIASILAMRDSVVPPTINHAEDDLDEKIDYRLDLTFNHAKPRSLRAAINNTFGFGGHNACLVLKKWEE